MTKLTVEEARKEYAEMMRLGMYHGAEKLREDFLFWHNVDIKD